MQAVYVLELLSYWPLFCYLTRSGHHFTLVHLTYSCSVAQFFIHMLDTHLKILTRKQTKVFSSLI